MIFIWIFCLVFRTLRRREVWASVFLKLVFIKRLCHQHFFGKNNVFHVKLLLNYFIKTTTREIVMYHTQQNIIQKVFRIHAFFIYKTFISKARLKLAQNQANVNQHPEGELQLFHNYSHLHPRYHPKILGHILKISKKPKVYLFMRLHDKFL